MKVAILNQSKMTMGGGWSFMRNFARGLLSRGELMPEWRDADICLIPSASMITKETFNLVKAEGKKIVLRVDNVPRDSRNRGTGTSRLKRMAERSDLVIYQSIWAKEYVGHFLKRDGPVVYNGVDTTVFKPSGDRGNFDGRPVYLYSRVNRDETKRWEWAWYKYQHIQRENPKAFLVIVGKFSPEQVTYNFDFYNNERYAYLRTIVGNIEMANVYRGSHYLLATYSNDAYSNTYLEALCCGVELFEPDMSGGTPELIMNYKKGLEYNSCERMVDDYLKEFATIL